MQLSMDATFSFPPTSSRIILATSVKLLFDSFICCPIIDHHPRVPESLSWTSRLRSGTPREYDECCDSRGMIIHVFWAAGREAENNKSVEPAEKLNPARNPNSMLYYCYENTIQQSVDYIQNWSKEHETKFEWLCNTTYECCDRCGRNKTDSNFFLSRFCCMYHSKRRPGIPNIIHGKNPDMYIPRLHVNICWCLSQPRSVSDLQDRPYRTRIRCSVHGETRMGWAVGWRMHKYQLQAPSFRYLLQVQPERQR